MTNVSAKSSLSIDFKYDQIPAAQLWPSNLAEPLAKINRFSGRTPGSIWSVAHHSLLASALAQDCPCHDVRKWALLHDAHEAFLGDLTIPAVRFIAGRSVPIAQRYVINSITQAKAIIDGQIRRFYGIAPFDKWQQQWIDLYDKIALAAELEVLFSHARNDLLEDFEFAKIKTIGNLTGRLNFARQFIESSDKNASWEKVSYLFKDAANDRLALATAPI